jgi:hypothetical protein
MTLSRDASLTRKACFMASFEWCRQLSLQVKKLLCCDWWWWRGCGGGGGSGSVLTSIMSHLLVTVADAV